MEKTILQSSINVIDKQFIINLTLNMNPRVFLYLFQYLFVRHYTLAFHANLKTFVESTSRTVSSASFFNLTLVIVRTCKLFRSFYRTAKESLQIFQR